MGRTTQHLGRGIVPSPFHNGVGEVCLGHEGMGQPDISYASTSIFAQQNVITLRNSLPPYDHLCVLLSIIGVKRSGTKDALALHAFPVWVLACTDWHRYTKPYLP